MVLDVYINFVKPLRDDSLLAMLPRDIRLALGCDIDVKEGAEIPFELQSRLNKKDGNKPEEVKENLSLVPPPTDKDNTDKDTDDKEKNSDKDSISGASIATISTIGPELKDKVTMEHDEFGCDDDQDIPDELQEQIDLGPDVDGSGSEEEENSDDDTETEEEELPDKVDKDKPLAVHRQQSAYPRIPTWLRRRRQK